MYTETTQQPIHQPADQLGTDPFATGAPAPDPGRRATPSDDDGSNRPAVIAASVATLLMVASLAFVVLRGNDTTTADAPTSVPTTAPVVTQPVVSTPTTPTPSVPDVSTPPVVPAPPTITAPPTETTPPVVPSPVAPPVAPPVETVPPVQPPAPSGKLVAQADYVLDPGVDAVSIGLSNTGDLALNYSIVNDGEGFTADAPDGNIDPGASNNIWIQLDVESAGDGPTLFEQVVQISSDGGDAAVTISGQVEKPGFVIAEFEAMPLVDYRATIRFTNVGGLPVEITGLDAPGLRYAPIPDEIAAGETFELDVAICEGGGNLPIFAPQPQPQPQPQPNPLLTFMIGSWVELETVSAPDAEPTVARTDLNAVVTPFAPLDCSPVVLVPTGDLTFDLG